MLNTVYRLVAPRRFEVAFSDIQLFKENQVIVRPQFLYLSRRPEILSGTASCGHTK